MKIQCDCQGWKDRYGNLNYCSDCGKSLYIEEAANSTKSNTTKATIALLQEYFDIFGVCPNAGVDGFNCQCLTCRTEQHLEKIAQK